MNVRQMLTYLRLEPYEGKLLRAVLRRERRGNPPEPADINSIEENFWLLKNNCMRRIEQWQKRHGGNTSSSFPYRRIRRCQDRIKDAVAHHLFAIARINRGGSNGTLSWGLGNGICLGGNWNTLKMIIVILFQKKQAIFGMRLPMAVVNGCIQVSSIITLKKRTLVGPG